MNNSYRVGVLAALMAAFAWSLNFVVPFVIGKYSVFDFALIRFGVSGALGLAWLIGARDALRNITLRDGMTTAWLAFIGYVGYFLTVTGAALYCGPVIAPAFLGLVPVVLAIGGNLRQKSVRWRFLALPLALVMIGLLLVNRTALTVEGLGSARALWIGIPLALTAVVLWVWFAIANEAALARRPAMPSSVWTGLTLMAGGIEMIVFFPLGMAMGLFELPKLGFAWNVAVPLYVWGVALAIFASVGGVWAWNVAARNLPVALAAQLIVSETAFGVMGGLVVHARLPSLVEGLGITILIAGVVAAIHVFHGRRQVAKPCPAQIL